MDKNYVLDNFDFVLDEMAWTKVLSGQKDEAKDKIEIVGDNEPEPVQTISARKG